MAFLDWSSIRLSTLCQINIPTQHCVFSDMLQQEVPELDIHKVVHQLRLQAYILRNTEPNTLTWVQSGEGKV